MALPALRGELRWSYGYTWTLQGVHATRAPLKRRHADAELWLERLAEPLAALALVHGTRGRPAAPATRRGARSCARSSTTRSAGAPRMRWRAGSRRALEDAEQTARRDRAGEPRRADRQRSRPGPGAPGADPASRLVLWNPVARPREGAVVIADLSWFRRDVLVGPPGGRVPRSGAGARDVRARRGRRARSRVQLLGTARAHERLDAPRHYPDQDEVDVTRVAFRAPRLGGFGVGVAGAVRSGGPAFPGVRSRGRAPRERAGGAGGRSRRLRVPGAIAGPAFAIPRLLGLESSGDVGDTYTYAPPPRDRVRFMRGPA